MARRLLLSCLSVMTVLALGACVWMGQGKPLRGEAREGKGDAQAAAAAHPNSLPSVTTTAWYRTRRSPPNKVRLPQSPALKRVPTSWRVKYRVNSKFRSSGGSRSKDRAGLAVWQVMAGQLYRAVRL